MKKILSLVLIIILSISGCSKSNDKLTIVTTIYPLYNIVYQQIPSNVDYELINIYPPGSDPHSYQLTSQNVKDLNNADYVFYISEHFEEWISDTQISGEEISVTEDKTFTSQVEPSLYQDDEIIDPHVFVSPKYLQLINQVIYEHLKDESKELKTNYENLDKELKEVDQEYQDFGQSFNKTLITSHEAYDYLNEYNISTIGLYGQHHDDEPTAKDVTNTINLIEEQDIKSIYTEQNDQDNDLIKQIANDSDCQVEPLNNLSTVSEQEFSDNISIVDLLNDNLAQMKKA